MKAKHQLLLHPFFLLSIALLLLNDLCLKPEFHSWLTGKLSDFTGLFAFTVFLLALFPFYKRTVILSVALAFLFWKSSLSNSLIHFLNTDLQIPFHRVIDYTDYVALTMLPLAYYLKPIQYRPSFSKQLAIGLSGMVALTAFVASSLPRRLMGESRIDVSKNVTTKKSEREVINSMQQAGVHVEHDSAIYSGSTTHHFFVKTKDSNGREVMTRLSDKYDTVYTRIEGASIYRIPILLLDKDTIYNTRFIFYDKYSNTRNDVWIHSFERNPRDSSHDYTGYFTWKKMKKPLKKKFKTLVK